MKLNERQQRKKKTEQTQIINELKKEWKWKDKLKGGTISIEL